MSVTTNVSYERPAGVDQSGRAVQPFQDGLSQTTAGQSQNPRHIPFIPPAYTTSSTRWSGHPPPTTRYSPSVSQYGQHQLPPQTTPPPSAQGPPVSSADGIRLPTPPPPTPRKLRHSASNVDMLAEPPRPVLHRPMSQMISESSFRNQPETPAGSYTDLNALAEHKEGSLPPTPTNLPDIHNSSQASGNSSSAAPSEFALPSISLQRGYSWTRPAFWKRAWEDKGQKEQRRLEAERRQRQKEEELRKQQAQDKVRLDVIRIVQNMIFTHHLPEGPSPMEQLANCSRVCGEVSISLSDILQTKCVEDRTPFYWIVLHLDRFIEKEASQASTLTLVRSPSQDSAAPDRSGSVISDESRKEKPGKADDKEKHEMHSILDSSSYQGNLASVSLPPILATILSYAGPLKEISMNDIYAALRSTSNNPLLQRLLLYPGFVEMPGSDKLILAGTIARDVARVCEGKLGGPSKFYVYIRIPQFHKRMKVAKRQVDIPFIARGRIWVLQLRAGKDESETWTASFAILGDSEETTVSRFVICSKSHTSAPDFWLLKKGYSISRSSAGSQSAFGLKVKAQGGAIPLVSLAPQTLVQSFFPSTRDASMNLQDENCPYLTGDADCTLTALVMIRLK